MSIMFTSWFEYLQESFSNNDVKFKFKKFYPPMKTSPPPAENIYSETPECK